MFKAARGSYKNGSHGCAQLLLLDLSSCSQDHVREQISASKPKKNSHGHHCMDEAEASSSIMNSKRPILSIFDIYESNIKIRDLGRHGRVKEARKLFDEMPQRDNVSCASMITVYLKNNCLHEAEKLFWASPVTNVVVESAMIDGYMKAGRTEEARCIFDSMTQRNVFSWTSLISGYFRLGNVDEARRLFDQMPVKNVVSWTAVVVGYARNGLIDEALHVFDQIPEKNVVAWTAMIKCCIENDQINEAVKLFKVMPQRNLYTWNIMISGCLDANRVGEAVQLFDLMPRRNAVSWTTMVTGLAGNGMTKHARNYFDRMVDKDIAAWNAMITAYVDEGAIHEAKVLFESMQERNVVTWNVMIDGYARHGSGGEALRHLTFMLRSGLRPNETTITSVLTSCEGIVEIVEVHALVIFLGLEHDTLLMNSLVTMYSRGGDVNAAKHVFERIEFKDVVSWTAMMLACSIHGFGYEALTVFTQMLKSGLKPDEITFVGILSACSHSGLVTKGQCLFNSMSSAYDLQPRAEHYSCLVDILGRAGQVNEAMRIITTMPSAECDGAVLGALLGACRLHGNAKLASQVGEKLIEIEPASSGGYVLLANAYAACGKWDEFAEVRRLMKEREVRKVAGFSQIEVKGKNHVFFVGDKSHPQVEEIYRLLLDRLLPVMQMEKLVSHI